MLTWHLRWMLVPRKATVLSYAYVAGSSGLSENVSTKWFIGLPSFIFMYPSLQRKCLSITVCYYQNTFSISILAS